MCIYVQKYRGFQQFFSGLSLILVFAAFNQFAQFVLHFDNLEAPQLGASRNIFVIQYNQIESYYLKLAYLGRVY